MQTPSPSSRPPSPPSRTTPAPATTSPWPWAAGGRMDEGKTMMTRFQEIRKSPRSRHPRQGLHGAGKVRRGRWSPRASSWASWLRAFRGALRRQDDDDRRQGLAPVPVTGIHLADIERRRAPGRPPRHPEGLRLLLNTTAGSRTALHAWGLPASPTAARGGRRCRQRHAPRRRHPGPGSNPRSA